MNSITKWKKYTTKDLMMNLNQDNEYWLKVAELYLDFNWSIVPIGSNKRPLIKWKEYQNRLPGHEEVVSWSQIKYLAGYAVVTGKTSNVFILDLDSGSAFDASNLPHTPHSQTGSGGHHFYFKCSDEEVPTNAAGFVEKTDFRGEGGYAILPPSRHPSGNHYKWVVNPKETPLAELPNSIKVQLSTQRQTPLPLRMQQTGINIFEGVSESRRNDAATRVIGFFLAKHDPKEWIPIIWPIVKSWNITNQPPLPEDELKATFKSILSKEAGKRRAYAKNR